MRQADELSTTIAPAAAKRGAHSLRGAAAGARRGRGRSPGSCSSAQRLDDQPAVELRPGGALARRTGRSRSAGKPRAREQLGSMIGADGAGGADDGDADRSSRELPERLLGRIVSVARSSNALCSARTAPRHAVAADDAGDLDRRRRDHLDVDALVAERREDLRGDARDGTSSPRRRSRPCPSPRRSAIGDAELGDERRRARRARVAQVVARDRERHVGAARSDDGLVLDDHVDVDVRVGERGRDPAGDARACRGRRASVTRASSVEWVTAVMSGCSMVVLLADDNGTRRRRRSWTGSGCARRGCARTRRERSCSTPAPEAAISSISSKETTASLRASGTMRGSALKTPATSV